MGYYVLKVEGIRVRICSCLFQILCLLVYSVDISINSSFCSKPNNLIK